MLLTKLGSQALAAEEKKRMEAVKAERELEAARLRAWKEEADAAAARAAEEKKMLADKAAAAERAAGEAAVILRVLIHDVRAGSPAKCWRALSAVKCSRWRMRMPLCVRLIMVTPMYIQCF